MNLLSMVVGTSNIFEKKVSIYLDLDIKDELEDKTVFLKRINYHLAPSKTPQNRPFHGEICSTLDMLVSLHRSYTYVKFIRSHLSIPDI